MSIVWQFLVFVDDFLLGSIKEDTNQEVFNSRNVMESVQESITNIINKHTQSVDQNAYVEKNINIDCGSSNLTSFQLLLRNKEHDFWGNEIEGTGCPSYGCCYDIQQSANIKLSAINRSIMAESNNMFNKIEQTLKQNVDMTVTGGKDLQVLNDAISTSRSEVINSINSSLEQATNVDVRGDQNIDIVSTAPLKCVNSCDEPPSAGDIKQSLNVDILSQNIAVTSLDIVNKNVVKMKSETTTEFSDTDSTKTNVFMTIFIVLLIIFTFICYYIGTEKPTIVHYIIAIWVTVMLLLFVFYPLLRCFFMGQGTICFYKLVGKKDEIVNPEN